ncbi:uncharacterized protein [Coffea arabica]|uniref:Retroviral polymerase SH3-like domain-containing protein n=1 Tax=Coffea arabica TaxID=13443 RepID=A0ABM4UPX5_COFAR
MGCYIVNRSPSASLEFKNFEEVWSGTPADYFNLKVFGCPTYMHVNDGKLESKAKKYIFLGYASGVKGYRLWYPDPKSLKFVISRYVTFDELSMLSSKKESSSSCTTDSTQKQVEFDIGSSSPSQTKSSIQQMPVDTPESTVEDSLDEEKYSIARDRPKRDIRPSQIYANLVVYALSVAEETNAVGEPSTYSEAISCGDSAKWLIAMNEEIESLHQNEIWVHVKPPSDKKIIGCK